MKNYNNIIERYINNINYYAAPGMALNRIVAFQGNKMFLESCPEGVDVEKDGQIFEDYINHEVAPWVLVCGIMLSGMDHGSFVRNRDYCKAVDVERKREEDYYLNTDILNYAYACMAAYTEHSKGKESITLVEYIGEAGTCVVSEFKDEEDMYRYVGEFLEEVESYEECYEEEDK